MQTSEEEEFQEFCSILEQDKQPSQEPGSGQRQELEEPYFRERDFDPQYVLKKEEPQHRAICVLACEGFTNKEISEKLGFTPAMVSYVKKQPWALEFMARVQGDMGRAVKRELTGGALEAAKLLVETVNGNILGAKAGDRIKAANDILNRLYGTAPQLVVHGHQVDPKDLSDEELAKMLKMSQ